MATEVQKKLRAMRRAFNIPQRELATAIGVTTAAVSNYELGPKEPNPERIRQIVYALYRLSCQNPHRRELPVFKDNQNRSGGCDLW